MSLSCPKIVSQFSDIQSIRIELDLQEAECLRLAKDPSVSREDLMLPLRQLFINRSSLVKSIRELRDSLTEFVFTVQNAVNPYAEALKDGGITHPYQIAERIDVRIDLREILTQDLEAYRSAGCDIWANALPERIEDLNLTKEQIEIIKARVELGEIPIVMPGRMAQINGLMQAIEKLKPKVIKNGEGQTVIDTDHWEYVDKLIEIMREIAVMTLGNRNLKFEDLEKLKKHSALFNVGFSGLIELVNSVASLPEAPYIFTASTSQKNDIRTRDKALHDQFNELLLIQSENPELHIDCQSIGEYLALQNRFTGRFIKRFITKLSFKMLTPLDGFGPAGGTVSRFINLPATTDSRVPSGTWRPDRSQVSFIRDAGAPNSVVGFRVSVRGVKT